MVKFPLPSPLLSFSQYPSPRSPVLSLLPKLTILPRFLPLLHLLPPSAQSRQRPLARRSQIPDRLAHHPQRRRLLGRSRAPLPERIRPRPRILARRREGDAAAGEERAE